ncbi:MAG: acetyl-CoA carboxylase biotin carboxylase subunit [Balneolaceae bacterium]|nr:MAG: acetyl-CoA carboxylase biotin carboxylase subunit [Balneolaceae bacterium]
MANINKILVANRGEIALRVIRTCRERGIKTVAVFSSVDHTSPHVLFADESVHIGNAASSESYLVHQKIIDAAKLTGADAIHPGYGFLSENAAFAKLCIDNDIIFIGPSPRAIELMGDKTKARELAKKANVPLPPGTESDIESLSEAKIVAREIGFPVLIKAAAGGGGKGMRIVHDEDDFENSIKAARSEAQNAFGDGRVFLEKYLDEPHHIEFQVFGDTHGNVIHMFERECSIQRRHQKVIEEAPSPFMTDDLRKLMAEAAVAAAKSCGYYGAGTVEFLVDKHRSFYFLEMNTRLQVEHPVTELITGIDLVSLQIDIAEGKKLPFTQDQVTRNGHAIECRIYAEDPFDHFLPSTGKLSRHRIPSGNGVRVDSGIDEGQEISIYYDPMISKLCVHATDRKSAIQKMIRALDEYTVSGVKTTIPFCKFVMNEPHFREGNYDTHFIPNYYQPQIITENSDNKVAALVSSILLDNKYKKHPNKESAPVNHSSNWWTKRQWNT